MNRYLFTAPEVLPEIEDELLYWAAAYFRRRRDPLLRAELRGVIARLREVRELRTIIAQRVPACAAGRTDENGGA